MGLDGLDLSQVFMGLALIPELLWAWLDLAEVKALCCQVFMGWLDLAEV